MQQSQTVRTLLALAILPSLASAQFTVTFDSSAEGFVGTAYTTPVGTFQQIVLDDGSAGQFAIEDASGVTFANGLTTRSLPNMLGAGGFAPGPGFDAPKIRSFRWLLPAGMSSVRYELYYCTYGHTLRVDQYYQGQIVTTSALAAPTGDVPPMLSHRSFDSCTIVGAPWPIDEVRFWAAGPNPSPRVTLAIDDVRLSNVSCQPPPRICSGAGTGACPCANAPAPGTEGGCLHSAGASPLLSGSGAASIGADDFTVAAFGVPSGTIGLLIGSGTTVTPAAFGDGVLCVGPAITRIRVNGAVGTVIGFGTGLAAQSGLTGPSTQRLQVWYRDAGTFCTSATFNVTNGVEVTWTP